MKFKEAYPRKGMTITICGSSRFKDEFIEVNASLSRAGAIVYSIAVFKEEETLTAQEKEILDEVHFRKIDKSEEILVIDRDGYSGVSTNNEIAYAQSQNIPVRFLSDVVDSDY